MGAEIITGGVLQGQAQKLEADQKKARPNSAILLLVMFIVIGTLLTLADPRRSTTPSLSAWSVVCWSTFLSDIQAKDANLSWQVTTQIHPHDLLENRSHYSGCDSHHSSPDPGHSLGVA